ncbi:MAG: hypothetical protein RL885_02320 [Planctomycetota bacterium]
MPAIAAAQCAPDTPSPSVWFNEQNGTFDADLLEGANDVGSGLYDDMLSNLIVRSTWDDIGESPSPSWSNPVDYSGLSVSFAWAPEGLLSGETCYADRLSSTAPNSAKSITYKYRRFSLNGASGVVYFHSSFTGACLAGNVDAYAFIHNHGTCCDLHEDEYLGDQPDNDSDNKGDPNSFCYNEPIAGPAPPTQAIAALLRPWDPQNGKIMVFVHISGGPGPHSALTRLQQTLLARKAIDQILANHTLGYCINFEKVFLTGGSFGSAVALAAQMIYPQLFDGALVGGNSYVSSDAFFGYERFFGHAQGQIAYRAQGTGGGASPISMADYWTYDQFQRVLEAKNTTDGSWGFANMSLLDRLVQRIDNYSVTGEYALTDPVIIVNGDEDPIAQGSHFRHTFKEHVLDQPIGSTGSDYDSLIKVINVPFRDHGNPAGEGTTIALNPQHFLPSGTVQPSSTSNTVDWLIYLAENNTLSDPTSSPDFDEGVPEPNKADDYRFKNFLFTSPPETESEPGSLKLQPAWSNVPFLGTGTEPGLNDNLLVANIDGDSALEVVWGDNDGFVHIYEWDSSQQELVFKWRSPDMGHGVGTIGLGEFTADGGGTEKGLIAMSASGEVWAIQTETTPDPTAHTIAGATLLFGGEREMPVLAIGERSGDDTPVYVVGTSPYVNSPPGSENGDHPNYCHITRFDVTSIYNFSMSSVTVAHQEPCEPMTQLQWDADNDELIGTTARGYLYRIEDASGSDFKFLSTTDNFGLGEYMAMSGRQAKRVDLDGTDLYFVVGSSQTDRNAVSPPDQRNLVALSACGTKLAYSIVEKGLALNANRHNLRCLEVIATGTDTVRLAVGGIDGLRIVDFNYDSTTPANSAFTAVADSTSAASFWSARRRVSGGSTAYVGEPVISLEYFQENTGSVVGRLVGTTQHGVVFVWDVPIGLSAPPQFPTVVDQLSPYWHAVGLKVIDRKMSDFPPYDEDPPDQPFDCPIDNDFTLNLMPYFSYDHTLTPWDSNASNSFFEKRDGRNGDWLGQRNRPEVGQALTPDRRPPDLFSYPTTDQAELAGGLLLDLFFHADSEPLLETHYFQETVDVGETDEAGVVDAAYTDEEMDGTLKQRLDYVSSTSTESKLPSSGSYLLTDRYYVNSQVFRGSALTLFQPVYFGNAIRIGDIDEPETGDPELDDIVMTTIGGRLVVVSNGTATTSWNTSSPWSETGDFGMHLSALALCDVDGDGYDEIFAIAGTNSDPAHEDNINSHLLIWDTSSSLNLASPSQRIDLEDIGCFGLWVGPALQTSSDEDNGPFDIIIGGSQTFSVFRINTAQTDWIDTSSPSYVSEGLGTSIGAFNSIRVHRDIDGQGLACDYIFLGSSAYYYAFKCQSFSMNE